MAPAAPEAGLKGCEWFLDYSLYEAMQQHQAIYSKGMFSDLLFILGRLFKQSTN